MTRLLAANLALVLAVASVAAVTLPARTAGARDEDDAAALKRAQAHFKKGEKLFALGRFAEALDEYQKAFEEYPIAELLFNIGQCHRNLGAYDEAIFSFRKYLRLKPDAENREATEEYIAELEAEKARAAPRPVKPRIEPIPDGKPEPAARVSKQPIYTRWWFWTGLVVVAGATATAIIIASDDSALPDADLPAVDFPK